MAKQLVEAGQAYYCFCSRERLEEVRKKNLENKTLPRYDRHCRALDPRSAELRVKAQESHVIRLKVPESGVTTCSDVIRGDVSWENSGLDDQVLQKSDGYPTYHLGVVVDDHLMGVTHIIRGEEWLSSSPKHILLYQAFGWELPIFAHLPVIRNKDKSKMSKRKNDVSILSHRDRGYLPEAIMNFMALMGWSHPEKKEIFPVTDFVKYFSLERVTLTAPVYDIDKLNWLNGQYIRALNDKELSSRLIPFIPSDCPKNLVSQLIPLVKERLVTLKDFEELTKFFYRDIEVDHSLLHKKSNPEQVKEQLSRQPRKLPTMKINPAVKNIEDLPVVFFIAKERNQDPKFVIEQHNSGKSWHQILFEDNIKSKVEILNPNLRGFVLSSVFQPSLDKFGEIHRFSGLTIISQLIIDDFDRKEIKFNDKEINNLINLRLISKYYDTNAYKIMALRDKGQRYDILAMQFSLNKQ